MAAWQSHWSDQTWREYLRVVEMEPDLTAICRCTYTGRSLGTAAFIASIEKETQRRLTLKKGGRPKKSIPDQAQSQIDFAD